MILDKIYSRFMYPDSLREWMLDNDITIDEWLHHKVHPASIRSQREFFWLNPAVCKSIIEDYIMTETEKKELAYNMMFEGDPKIIMLIGKKGSGKTALGYSLMEKAYEYGLHPVLLQEGVNVPDYITCTEDLFSVAPGSFVIFDEASIRLNPRSSMTNFSKDIGSLMAISRQRKISLVIISQHSGLVDLNVMRLCDLWIFKQLSLEEIMTDNDTRGGKNHLMKFVNRMMPTSKSENLITDGDTWFKFSSELASFWNVEVHSFTYKALTNLEAFELALKMKESGLDPKQILKEIKIRGINMELSELKENLKNPVRTRKELANYEKNKDKIKDLL